MKTIWILEDDTHCQFVYKDILEAKYTLCLFESFQELMNHFTTSEGLPSLLIVDLKLSDGFIIEHIKSEKIKLFKETLFMVVSSNDDLQILRSCYENGAIDYLTKPFNKTELLLKVERAINLDGSKNTAKILNSYTLLTNEKTLSNGFKSSPELTPKECQILYLFSQSSKSKVAKKEILEKIWKSTAVTTKTIDVHISNLRKKIAEIGLTIRFSEDSYYIEKI